MAKQEQTVLFEVTGFKVKSDSTYRVKHKIDYDAPSGFKKLGMSKVPGTGGSFQAPFTGVSPSVPNSGRWDIGIHTTSLFYKFEDNDKVREEKVKVIIENVIEPYIKASGTKYTLEDFIRGEDELFRDLDIKIKEDKIFNTNDPESLLELYISLLQRKLAPVGRESESTFEDASYAIENLSEKRTRTNVVSKNSLTASSLFSEILKTDVSRARALLIYMGESVGDTTEEDVLIDVFMERVLKEPSKVDTFLANYDNFSTKVGELELNMYNFLKKAVKSPSSKVTVINGQLFYDDINIGADIKSAAKALSREKSGDLKAIQKEILLGDEDN